MLTTDDTPMPPSRASSSGHGGWRQVNGGPWIRECVGGEHGASFNQNVRDGHTELTLEVPFSVNLSVSEMVQRARNAWLLSHSLFPSAAIQLSTGTEMPQMMKFEMLQSDADAASWLGETFHVVTDQRACDVASMTYGRRLPTKGKRSMIYLVTAPAADPAHPDQHSLVWNISHALTDVFSIMRFLNHFFQTLTHTAGDSDLAVADVDYSGVFHRLPLSPVVPYEAQYQPTKEQRQQALEDAWGQSDLLAAKMPQSIAMYPEDDTSNRDHKTHCIRLQYTLDESQMLFAELQREKLSITFATAAATLLAVKQTYAQGHETGALLGMTRNARRWIDTEGQRVPCASDVVFLWIPFEPSWFRASTRDTILTIARAIRTELGPHLVSPHYLASVSFTGNKFVEGLAAEQEPTPAPSVPGFSSQGALALEKEFHSDTASVVLHDFIHTGRQINASPWVGMFSIWKRITLSLGFDSKYYEPARMNAFMTLVKGNLGSIMASPRYVQDGYGLAAKL